MSYGILNQANENPNRPPIKVYRALLTQTSTGDPTVVVLHDYIGTDAGSIVWARTGTGVYTGTLTGAFVAGRTFVRMNDSLSKGTNLMNVATIAKTSADVVTISTYVHSATGGTVTATDALLTNTEVEILVYP